MQWLTVLTLLGACTYGAIAQVKGKAANTKGTPAINCADKSSSKACESFRQMIQSRDPDILRMIQEEDITYVCPRPGVDEFFVFSLDLPLRNSWRPSDPEDIDGFQTQLRGARLSVYADGVLDRFLIGRGKWLKTSQDAPDSEAFFNAEPEGIYKLNVSAEESEINLENEFTNVRDEKVIYSQTIRRSTGRFKERWRVRDAKVDFSQNQGQCFTFRK